MPLAVGGTTQTRRVAICAQLLVLRVPLGGALLALEVVWFRFLSHVRARHDARHEPDAGGRAGGDWCWVDWRRRRGSAHGRPSGAAVPAIAFACRRRGGPHVCRISDLTTGTQVGEWSRVLWFASVLTLPTAVSVRLPLHAASATRCSVERTRRPRSAAAWLTLANTRGRDCGPAACRLRPAALAGHGADVPRAGDGVRPRARSSGSLGPGTSAATRDGLAAAAGGDRARRRPLAFSRSGTMGDRYFLRAASAYAGDGSTIVATREGPSETLFVMQQQWLGQAGLQPPGDQRFLDVGHRGAGHALHALRSPTGRCCCTRGRSSTRWSSATASA